MAETKYNLIEVVLRKGPRNRQKVNLPSVVTAIDIPRYKGSDLLYDRYCYTKELSTDEWPVFQFRCTHHTPGQDVV